MRLFLNVFIIHPRKTAKNSPKRIDNLKSPIIIEYKYPKDPITNSVVSIQKPYSTFFDTQN